MRVPHLIPYQGSKRKLAQQILKEVKTEFKGTFYEPFAGSAAITLAAASAGIGSRYVICDKYEPLIHLWIAIINNPEIVAKQYAHIWNKQLSDPRNYYLDVRNRFNSSKDPVELLYLIARCVKNSIRFNSNGEFNQSADNRRLGMHPSKVLKQAVAISVLLKNKVNLVCGDFMDVLEDANSDDFVYLDPPYQGTSQRKDPRYAYGLDFEKLVNGLGVLQERKVPFLLSYDGSCGNKIYGKALPTNLRLKKIDLRAGKSSQATLLGRNDITIESLYIHQ